MIRSTTDPTFLRWGFPVPSGAEQTANVDFSLSSGETVTLYRFDRDTVWDHGSGMTALLVEEDGVTHCFYLDRAVQLRAGVVFGFAPLQGTSGIRCEDGLELTVSIEGKIPSPVFTAALQPMQIFTCLAQKAEGGFYFPGEQHLPMELLWLKRGTLHNYCSGEDQLLHAKELLLIPAGQWHIQYADETVQFLTVSFLWEGRDLSPLTGVPLKVTPEAERYLSAMEQELSHEREDKDELLHATLKLLLIHLQRQRSTAKEIHRAASPAAEQMQRQLIDKAMQAVSAHIRGRYSVPELAAAVNLSQTHLTNLFQRYLGMSPAKYITRIRVEECKALLSGGEMSVGEIAALMGYSSIPHFCKQFRQWTGLSPASFARQRKNEK